MSQDKTDARYPVSSPDIGALELEYVEDAVRSGWVSSIGAYVDRFEREFAAYCTVPHGVAMSNGTDALFIALKALGIGAGDEVIVPALTFVAVPAVVLHVGATPVVVDVDPRHWCIDPRAVERAVTTRTKAMIAVHTYGHPADMDPIMAVADSAGVVVVEDCAEAHGARYKGRVVGSIGAVGCFSFYGNKVITTGEGGMAVTADEDLAARMRFLKDHAMDPKRRYYHPEAGFNCRMTNVQAALGCAQLARIDELLARRARVLSWYRSALGRAPGLALNPREAWADPVSWLVCAVLAEGDVAQRDAALAHLRDDGVDTRPFFVPVNEMPPYARCRTVGADSERLPVASRLSRTGFNLPTQTQLGEDDVAAIAERVVAALATARGEP